MEKPSWSNRFSIPYGPVDPGRIPPPSSPITPAPTSRLGTAPSATGIAVRRVTPTVKAREIAPTAIPVESAPLSGQELGEMPILYRYGELIFESLSVYPLSGLLAPTGSGKSLAIPKIFAEKGWRVIVSVPTIIAAHNLYMVQQRLSPELKVGKAAEGRINYDSSSQIIYMTSGHLLNLMLASFGIDGNILPSGLLLGDDPINRRKTLIMIDEVHTGSTNNEVIIALHHRVFTLSSLAGQSDWQELFPRMMLVSADFDTTRYKWGGNAIPIWPSSDSAGRPIYPEGISKPNITISYLSKKVDEKGLIPELVRLVQSEHKKQPASHNFLIFVAGSWDIDRVIEALNRQQIDAIVLSLHGGMEEHDREIIYSPSPTRKIIVSTNVAESSVTIPDVAVVFDSMLEKVPYASTTAGDSIYLKRGLVTKSSARQRCGRTGRTMRGKCVRMMTEAEFKQLDGHRVSELLRLPLHQYVLRLMERGIRMADLFQDQPVRNSARAAEDFLTKLGAVDHRLKITDQGRFSAKIPISVRNSALLWFLLKQYEDRNVWPFLSICCLIDSYGEGYFSSTEQDPSLCGITLGSDSLTTMANMWDLVQSKIDSIRQLADDRWRRQLITRTCGLRDSNLRDLANKLDMITPALKSMGYKVTPSLVAVAIRPVALTAYDNNTHTNLALKSSLTYFPESREAVQQAYQQGNEEKLWTAKGGAVADKMVMFSYRRHGMTNKIDLWSRVERVEQVQPIKERTEIAAPIVVKLGITPIAIRVDEQLPEMMSLAEYDAMDIDLKQLLTGRSVAQIVSQDLLLFRVGQIVSATEPTYRPLTTQVVSAGVQPNVTLSDMAALFG